MFREDPSTAGQVQECCQCRVNAETRLIGNLAGFTSSAVSTMLGSQNLVDDDLGLTAERVLVNADTGVHPDLLNSRFGYVAISRASHDATLYTDDMTKIRW
jgi:hypothetical protein